MARRFISTGSVYEKLAGYSRAVVEGDWVFVSGTVGLDYATKTFPKTAEAQAEKAIDTIAWALKEAKASVLDVVRVRVFIPNPKDVEAVSRVVARRLGPAKAANTTVCSALAVPEAKVEIEVTVKRRRGRTAK
jgi:enamine deaminase RidA (YjgF/YER057c/UK114 family)